MKETSKQAKQYWEKNIEGFSGFYDKGSEEVLSGPKAVTSLYRVLLLPIEKAFMKKRYDLVSSFIDEQISEGTNAADIGCGSGIFTAMMARKGAHVLALDLTKSALSLTKQNLPASLVDKVDVRQHDIAGEPIGKVDVAIAVGVLPYVEDAEGFLKNICPHCSSLLFNYLDAGKVLNRVRKRLQFLDVRGYYYHEHDELAALLSSYGFSTVKFVALATGYVVIAHKDTTVPQGLGR